VLADLRGERFELTSRGDRVPGRLLLPAAGPGPFPLVLLQHGLGGAKDASYLDAVAGPWARRGAAVASIDFPLHGERASAKLSQKLLATVATRHVGEADGSHALWVELVRQAVADLRRTLDALALHPGVDSARCAYAGFSLGTILGVPFCALDPRPCAAAFALGGAGFGPPEVDPARFIARLAPRPVLFVNATRDETVPRAASEALAAAAGEPKRIEWFDSGHSSLPGSALKAMWQHVAASLGLN
jgi:dienelactone hydrolase